MKTPENIQAAYWEYTDHWLKDQKKINAYKVYRTQVKKYLTLLKAIFTTLAGILGFYLVLVPAGEPLGPGDIDQDLLGVILIVVTVFPTLFGPIIGGSSDDRDDLPPPKDPVDITGGESSGTGGQDN